MGKGVIWWLSLLVGTIAQLCLSPAIVSAQPAQATGTPTIYKITFSINFRSALTQQFLPTAPFDVTNLDIGSVIPGGTVTSGGAILPIDDYDKAKATLNCTIRLKGSVTFGPNTFITTSAGGAIQGVAADAVEGPYSLPASLCTTPPSVTAESDVFATPISIGGGLTVTFNAADTLRLNGAPASPALEAGPFSLTLTVTPAAPAAPAAPVAPGPVAPGP